MKNWEENGRERNLELIKQILVDASVKGFFQFFCQDGSLVGASVRWSVFRATRSATRPFFVSSQLRFISRDVLLCQSSESSHHEEKDVPVEIAGSPSRAARHGERGVFIART